MAILALRIWLFGQFELVWGDAPLSIPQSSAARSLLAYLIVHHDRAIPRDRLTGIFWPERPDPSARRALSQALWQIRQSLRPAAGRLVTERDAVTFVLHPGDWLDVKEFEEKVHRDTTSTQVDRYTSAVALYRADFLQDTYDDWALLERERLRELYLGTLERLITLHKQRGNYEQALTCAQRLAGADPLREAAHRELMRLYYLLDRPRAALEQFASLRNLLAEELRVLPASATVSLYQEIAAALEETVSHHLPVAPPPPPLLHDLAHLPFVGRANERAVLLYALQTAAQGQGGLALVEGDAGVGKTRLVNEIIADAQWRGFQVGLGKVDPLAAAASYQLLRDALSPLLTSLRIAQLAELVEPLWLSAVIPLFPAMAEHLPDLVPLAPLEPHEEQQRMWEGFARCLVGLASIFPLLLVLEDLHWADEATLAALPHLAPHLRTNRILLVLTCRIAEARERPAVWETLEALDRALPLLRSRLLPLERADAVALVRRALGVGEADVQATIFARRLLDETGGNALFLVETLKSLLEQETLTPSPDGGWVFPSEARPLPIPASVRELISARLARLSPALRVVLELVAVIGEDADFSVLSHASDAEPVSLISALEELGRRGFLVETEARYCFEHDRIQEIVYQTIAPECRRTLHRQAGIVLERLHPERIEPLAHHFDRGDVREKALAYTLQAGERAGAVYDYETALIHYRRALALVGDDPAARWDVLARQERALDVLSRREAQSDVLDEMLHLAEALDDPVRQARTYHRQGWWEVLAGEPVRALLLLDEADGLARAAGERDLLGDCLTSAARAWWRIGDVARCQAAVEEARALFQETGNCQNENRVLNMLGNLHLGLTGNYAQALTYFEENQRVAHELGDRYREAAAQANSSIACTLLGCYRRSQEALAEAYQVMTRVGDRNWQSIILHWQGANYRGLGDLGQAQTAAEESLGICREVGNRNFEIAALELLGQIALERHNPGQARLYFQQAVEVAQANQQTMDWAIQQSHLALACLHLGYSEEARRLSEQAIATLEGLGERFSHMGEVYFARYQIASAVEGSEIAQPYLERAYRVLQDMAADIDDLDLRRSFLENVAENRAIVTAHRTGRIPISTRWQSVCLPRADAPTGRPLRDDEYVEVTWTVAAPEDDEVSGKAWPELGLNAVEGQSQRVARRRHRLLRLLRQAREQGAAPTVDDLAAALEMSRATIKRDLAALRQAGHAAQTRGSRRVGDR